MSNNDIIRAWKDEDYSSSLSEEQRSQLPENPVGIVELSDEDMEVVAGGLNINSFGLGGCQIDSQSIVCLSAALGGTC
jgi:mersacidin/lichenicidin family type 2 lantibiotic